MVRSSLRLFLGSLIAMFLLVACVPPITQPAGPNAEQIQAQIFTSVALTLTAYPTAQATLFSPTAPPTETPAVTPTATFALPTFLPSATRHASVSTPAAYACAVQNKYPADNTLFKPNKDFDIKFWLRNIGSKRWGNGADLVYDSGTNMLTTNVIYELPAVDPGQTIGPFVFDAKTPRKAGTYVMNFKVQGGFCFPYIRIVVKP